ncbi:MAG: replication-associated recombination protein A [Deltaproteobacteria bacterium]|nr:replication-associated recombination protein A [Deltaproteobacteria bacterium]MBW1873482.1 replication-associated recombination protein A [Deltaproteobacteria bacterium]
MRPGSIEEFVGQEEILGEGRMLLQAIKTDSLPSMILWGPPGCGKTALASVIAASTGAEFIPFSAVLGGVKEVRTIVKAAALRRDAYRKRTILFIDEIHRMNKAQQDGLLPHVEKGTVVLIGATTENPSFEVISALLSRAKVFVLKPLDQDQLAVIVKRALTDGKRGLGKLGLRIDDPALADLCRAARGDARRALNTLEAAAAYLAASENSKEISKEIVAEAVQHRTLLYDRAGEEHYNVVSAFIKSLRGSDPDAAVYWMTRMLEAGEDPRFIIRRMIIFASEDIGNADPQALQLATATLSAHEMVGLPESALCLSQAVTYLASAPKSNSALTAYVRARKDVHEKGAIEVPLHLRNAPTGLMRNLGYGREYRYPHNFDGHYVKEDYLPGELKNRVYYTPAESGYEKEIKKRLEGWKNSTEEEDE